MSDECTCAQYPPNERPCNACRTAAARALSTEDMDTACSSVACMIDIMDRAHAAGLPARVWMTLVIQSEEVGAALGKMRDWKALVDFTKSGFGHVHPGADAFVQEWLSRIGLAHLGQPDAPQEFDIERARRRRSVEMFGAQFDPPLGFVEANLPGPGGLETLIKRLFSEAPRMTDASGKVDPTQAPAIQCHVTLRNGQVYFGALSPAPEAAVYRMLVPIKVKSDPTGRGDRPALAEIFFDSLSIESVMVEREVKGVESPLIIS